MRCDDGITREARGQIGNESRTQFRPAANIEISQHVRGFFLDQRMEQPLDLPHQIRHRLDLAVACIGQILEVQAVHGLDERAALFIPVDASPS